MGLMLSVLIVCVGVIEALSCYEHFQYGFIHCATNIYETARRRSSLFLTNTRKRFKLLPDGSIGDDEDGFKKPYLKSYKSFDESIEYKKISDKSEYKQESEERKGKKNLEKEEKIDIVKKLLEKSQRPKVVRSVSLPELTYTERDVELSKIINELALEPIEEVNIDDEGMEEIDPKIITKEFDELFDDDDDDEEEKNDESEIITHDDDIVAENLMDEKKTIDVQSISTEKSDVSFIGEKAGRTSCLKENNFPAFEKNSTDSSSSSRNNKFKDDLIKASGIKTVCKVESTDIVKKFLKRTESIPQSKASNKLKEVNFSDENSTTLLRNVSSAPEVAVEKAENSVIVPNSQSLTDDGKIFSSTENSNSQIPCNKSLSSPDLIHSEKSINEILESELPADDSLIDETFEELFNNLVDEFSEVTDIENENEYILEQKDSDDLFIQQTKIEKDKENSGNILKEKAADNSYGSVTVAVIPKNWVSKGIRDLANKIVYNCLAELRDSLPKALLIKNDNLDNLFVEKENFNDDKIKSFQEIVMENEGLEEERKDSTEASYLVKGEEQVLRKNNEIQNQVTYEEIFSLIGSENINNKKDFENLSLNKLQIFQNETTVDKIKLQEKVNDSLSDEKPEECKSFGNKTTYEEQSRRHEGELGNDGDLIENENDSTSTNSTVTLISLEIEEAIANQKPLIAETQKQNEKISKFENEAVKDTNRKESESLRNENVEQSKTEDNIKQKTEDYQPIKQIEIENERKETESNFEESSSENRTSLPNISVTKQIEGLHLDNKTEEEIEKKEVDLKLKIEKPEIVFGQISEKSSVIDKLIKQLIKEGILEASKKIHYERDESVKKEEIKESDSIMTTLQPLGDVPKFEKIKKHEEKIDYLKLCEDSQNEKNLNQSEEMSVKPEIIRENDAKVPKDKESEQGKDAVPKKECEKDIEHTKNEIDHLKSENEEKTIATDSDKLLHEQEKEKISEIKEFDEFAEEMTRVEIFSINSKKDENNSSNQETAGAFSTAAKESIRETANDDEKNKMKLCIDSKNSSKKGEPIKEGKETKSAPEAFWLIFSGEYTKAMSKDWHSGHFSCWQCDEALTGQRYVLRDDHPYCIKCYESVFANVCEECNKTIGIDSKDLSYKDKHWHEACFLCNKCRVSLVDKQFGSKAEKIYCGNCYDAQFASRCDGCGEIFRAGTKKMEYKTRQWHEKCFCCCVCKTPIGTKSFIPREQEIYCATCYEEKFATRCVKCNKIITSGGVTYKNEPWHRECFTCTHCSTSLAGQRFTSRDEKPYCADCFGELFAKRCTSCSKPITGIGGTRFISFEDRHWHNDCFICAACKTSLVGRGFITDGDDIICPECAKQKLM